VRRCVTLAAFVATLAAMTPTVASGEKSQAALTETQAKASFLYNCAIFVG